jgi:hypothetical protein
MAASKAKAEAEADVGQVADARGLFSFLPKRYDWSERARDLRKEERLGNGGSLFWLRRVCCVDVYLAWLACLLGRREENIFSNDLQCMAAGIAALLLR